MADYHILWWGKKKFDVGNEFHNTYLMFHQGEADFGNYEIHS